MVYLTIKSGNLLYHTSKEEMEKDGIKNPSLTMEDAEFKALGGYARIISGKIVVGKTEAEKTAEKADADIQAWKDELVTIDREAGAGRAVRGAVLAAAVKAGVSNEDVSILQELETRANSLRQKISLKK